MAKVKVGKQIKNHHNPSTRFWGDKNFTPKTSGEGGEILSPGVSAGGMGGKKPFGD
jgi:hypothetical protein